MNNNIFTLTVDLEKNSYDINIGHNLLAKAGSLLANIIKKRRVFIVSDEKVAPLYLEILEKSLADANMEYASFILPSGENTKSFFWLEKICETILMGRIERSSVIIALGGGVIGDISGFAASIILRGVDFIQIPTTLLAQVDSSVGGKTAINIEYGKNLIGSFYQPKTVLIDITTLKTLDKRQIKSGYAEIVKYGLIKDVSFWDYLQENGKNVIALKPENLNYAICQSCKIKAEIVSKDEKENDIRALLNFGHSFGHSLEALADFNEKIITHGEAVAIGMLMAAKLSEDLNFIKAGSFEKIKNHFQKLELPTKIADINYENNISAEQVLDFMTRDKKNKNGQFNLVLLQEIGKAFVYSKALDDDIKKAISYFL